MACLKYLELANLGYWLNNIKPEKIVRFCNDTRKLSKDSCFLAIKTENADGNNFLQQALENGASCAIVNYPNPRIQLPQFVCENTVQTIEKLAFIARENFANDVIGITGSMGKTSTKDILSLLLDVNNNKTLLNENGKLGIPITLAKFENNENFGIVEIGVDQPNTMGQHLAVVRPTDCIITGITRIHIDGFGDENGIANEKFKLADFVLSHGGRCVLSDDLLQFNCFKKIAARCIVPSFYFREKSCYYLNNKIFQKSVSIAVDGRNFEFDIPYLMSDGVVKNFVLAAHYALKKKLHINFFENV